MCFGNLSYVGNRDPEAELRESEAVYAAAHPPQPKRSIVPQIDPPKEPANGSVPEPRPGQGRPRADRPDARR